MTTADELSGCRVVVVEDDGMLAMLLEDMLEAMDCIVVGSAGRLDAATRICADGAFDVALLDANLRGESVWPLAEDLQARHLPFVITTGYDATILPDSLRDAAVLRKPFRSDDLRTVLWDALHNA